MAGGFAGAWLKLTSNVSYGPRAAFIYKLIGATGAAVASNKVVPTKPFVPGSIGVINTKRKTFIEPKGVAVGRNIVAIALTFTGSIEWDGGVYSSFAADAPPGNPTPSVLPRASSAC